MAAKDVNRVGFVIQARLESERLPRKMLRPFAGTTLLDIALAKVRTSSVIPLESFFLAVHAPRLVEVGRRHGVNVIRRSRRSARGEDLADVYEWHSQVPFEYIVQINACAPLLPVETIDAFIEAFLASPCEGLFGVIRERDYFWDADGRLLTPWPADLKIMNTKRVGVTYRAGHCLYAGRRDGIANGVWMGTFREKDDPELYPLDPLEAFDIDHPWQFEMAECYYGRHVAERNRSTRVRAIGAAVD